MTWWGSVVRVHSDAPFHTFVIWCILLTLRFFLNYFFLYIQQSGCPHLALPTENKAFFLPVRTYILAPNTHKGTTFLPLSIPSSSTLVPPQPRDFCTSACTSFSTSLCLDQPIRPLHDNCPLSVRHWAVQKRHLFIPANGILLLFFNQLTFCFMSAFEVQIFCITSHSSSPAIYFSQDHFVPFRIKMSAAYQEVNHGIN